MNNKDFIQYVKEIERFYGQRLNDKEREVWYESLKFMTLERFNYIIAEIYKTNKFMPKLADIMEMHKQIPYTAATKPQEVKGHCKKCNDTGYIIHTKELEGPPYQYAAVCECGRQSRYDGRTIQDEKHRSNYYIPTVDEIGLEVKDSKPSKQQVLESMMKIKDSNIMPESIKEIIRREFRNMEVRK